MSFPRYPKYKDSGVEWLGEVPEHWEVKKCRRLFSEEREAAHVQDEQLSATQKYGVVPQKLFMELEDQKLALALSGLNNFKHVQDGDFVISLRSFQGGIELSKYSGCVSPAYTVLRPANSVVSSYWAYLLKSRGYIEALQTMTDGIRDGKNISYQQFGQIGVSLPPPPEQTAIAAFLDRETAKIDALVAEQKRLMELLKEKRQVVISHAVTRGLNPAAPLKDSGIEWLGQVPEHWDVKRIKNLCVMISKGTTPSTIGADFTDSGVRFLKAENITETGVNDQPEFYISEETNALLSRSSLKEGDVLVVIAGATTGKSTVLDSKLLPANTNQAVSFARPKAPVIGSYINLWLSTKLIRNLILLNSVQSAQPNLSMEDLGNIPIPLAPTDELDAIKAFLNTELIKLDTLTTEAQRAIALLHERRTALISAAVTGQIKVS